MTAYIRVIGEHRTLMVRLAPTSTSTPPFAMRERIRIDGRLFTPERIRTMTEALEHGDDVAEAA